MKTFYPCQVLAMPGQQNKSVFLLLALTCLVLLLSAQQTIPHNDNPAPVALSASLAQQKVQLTWVVAQELNSNHFVIERSVNGQDYKDIAIVFAPEISELKQLYKYDDKIAPAKNKTLYYRLRHFTVDGKTNTSPVQVVKLAETKQI
jgi:hypothetical protein